MSDIKFAVKNGRWELSYEGPEEFLRNDLRDLLEHLFASHIWGRTSDSETEAPASELFSDDGQSAQSRQIPQMTINTICAKLNCQTGPDLVVAACVYLTYIQGRETLARREILQAMREATRYYKDTYSSNLSTYLQTLVKQDKLMERTNEIYVLKPAFASEVEALLAQS
jgi:hypothetical protein